MIMILFYFSPLLAHMIYGNCELYIFINQLTNNLPEHVFYVNVQIHNNLVVNCNREESILEYTNNVKS